MGRVADGNYKEVLAPLIITGLFIFTILGAIVFFPSQPVKTAASVASQRVTDYETGKTIPCGSSTRTGSVKVYITEGTTATNQVTNRVSLGSQELWRQMTPVHAYVGAERPVATYVQYLVSPGVWHFDVTAGGSAFCEVTKL